VINRPLTLLIVILYSALVGGLRLMGWIGDRGAYVLFGFMAADLAATHLLLSHRSKRR